MKKIAGKVESFGFEDKDPWSLPVIKLMFSLPRLYKPLVLSFEKVYPGTIRYLKFLVKLGFIEYQDDIIIDTKTGKPKKKQSKPQSRYKLSSKGITFHKLVESDIRHLSDKYPKMLSRNYNNISKILISLYLQDTHARFGISITHLASLTKMPTKTVRYWVDVFIKDGYIRKLDRKVSDTRSVIPAHYRVNKLFVKQLSSILESVEDGEVLKKELKLNRGRFLKDINPLRVGISGATDYDHDVDTQIIISNLILSKNIQNNLLFKIEPKFPLYIEKNNNDYIFKKISNNKIYYQPDAQFIETIDGANYWSILEYERYQNRRDGWSHLEKFIGFVYINALQFEGGIIRFVVNSESRLKSYVKLIEAFADYLVTNKEFCPENDIILAVTTLDTILSAKDPLDSKNWYRIIIPKNQSDDKKILYHTEKSSPYNIYFSRK
jgi:hypothetical protein